MTEVVSVKFSSRGKSYFFDPNGISPCSGDKLIVETSKGLDICECALPAHYVSDESIISPLRPVIRIATEADLKTAEENKLREKEAFDICKKKIAEHGLDMKLVGVECGFEGNKILFFFTSDGRVDFRDLVKDLASVFRTRIELRQIGVRDETKMLGGLGICGKPYCCSQFLKDFQPVSTKMAKTQSMSLNPSKISGSCGRLMCCLRYEQEAYEDLIKTIPKNGAFVQTTGGYGNVVQTNIVRQKVKVRLDSEGEQEIRLFDADEVATVPGGRPKSGEPLPSVLNYVAKPKEEPKAEDDPWAAPALFAEDSENLSPTGENAANKRANTPREKPQKKNEGRRRQNTRTKPQPPKGEKLVAKPVAKVAAPAKDASGSGGKAAPSSKGNQNNHQAPRPKGENKQNPAKGKRRYYSKPKKKNPDNPS